MPAQSWEQLAAAQSAVLAAAGVNGTDPAAIAALLAGKSGRVHLALLDRADLSVTRVRHGVFEIDNTHCSRLLRL